GCLRNHDATRSSGLGLARSLGLRRDADECRARTRVPFRGVVFPLRNLTAQLPARLEKLRLAADGLPSAARPGGHLGQTGMDLPLIPLLHRLTFVTLRGNQGLLMLPAQFFVPG